MKKHATILIVDDDAGHRSMLRTLLEGWGHQTAEADDGLAAVEHVQTRPADIVLMDLKMVHMSGMEALEQIRSFNPAVPVIIMTAFSSVDTAVEALKKGAYDYLTKPLDFEKLRLTLERILEAARLRKENRHLKERLGSRFSRDQIIGNSPAMTRLLETVEQAAPSDASILITGESGTGKELIAGALHFNSARREGPFVKINCAAITETLLESELFGHEKGSFTGADKAKKGRFVQADTGTILLDEIGEMPLSMQAKLLRVLQEKEVTPVGGERTIHVDVRVIASTNKNLHALVEAGTFREDLFFRLNVVNLEVPPLRNRKEDIPELAHHFLMQFSAKNKKQVQGFTPDAMEALLAYSWPGNVRELMNAVERAVVLARSEYLSREDVLLMAERQTPAQAAPLLATGTGPASHGLPLSEVEKDAILRTLEATDNNKSEAARRLGITRKTLQKKLKQYGVS
ncbi:MAG: sigma-54 dependent transcriptional regulator [Thermodesulfobacteriota bacterium]|nr:sigma-54 dependent transcriptional regulator [Thermodesulfobacteriota bacterium]